MEIKIKEQVIVNTNSEIEALIKALRDIQEEIIELRDKNRELGNIKTDDRNKREESSIKEIQEEIVKIETTIGRTEIYKEILWKKIRRILKTPQKGEWLKKFYSRERFTPKIVIKGKEIMDKTQVRFD
ncbi:hypothetical protein RhiirA4_456581 [Rhizophagus irregularis]|uniref:Uncharacterized protein n=1 Tax=Rhizophagus irregularis TaxID=588596 RepID=A0A2I1G7V7_9GLOM|nr:hypothetical protein RhiirA4_456581 [Rhizophagus irregularis]